MRMHKIWQNTFHNAWYVSQYTILIIKCHILEEFDLSLLQATTLFNKGKKGKYTD